MDNFNLPQEKLQTLTKELTPLLNRLNIDNELDTQDFLLAEMITEQINSMVVARRKSKKLLGKDEETIQLLSYTIEDHTRFDIYLEELLKKIPNSNYSSIHEGIIHDLNIAVLSSFIPAYKISEMYNHSLHNVKNQKGDATEVLNRLLYEISNYCENFDYRERHEIQETIRTLSERLNSK